MSNNQCQCQFCVACISDLREHRAGVPLQQQYACLNPQDQQRMAQTQAQQIVTLDTLAYSLNRQIDTLRQEVKKQNDSIVKLLAKLDNK